MNKPIAYTDGDSEAGASVAQRVERELESAIVKMELQPGARLSEQELAERFGVSRQPVREALLSLRSRGLVSPTLGKGTTVSKLSISGMKQVRLVREALECVVVRQACESFDPVCRAMIDTILEAQRQAARAGQFKEFQELDGRFHATLAAGAGCELAGRMILEVKCHMDRFSTLTLWDEKDILELVRQHEAIVEAIDARDEARALQAVHVHFKQTLRALPGIVVQRKDLFE